MNTVEPHVGALTLLGRTWVRVGVISLVVLVAGVFVAQAVRKPGVYWSDVHVRFVPPANPTNPNSLQVSERSLVMTAGAVGQAIDDRSLPPTASPDVQISGLGVRSGFSITLPNTGGQFQSTYITPYLDVQVVGPSEFEVARTTKNLVAAIKSKLTELQDKSKVAAADRISAKILPETNAPVYFEQGSRKRAIAAAFVIMAALAAATGALMSRIDRRLRRRHQVDGERRDAVALVG
jgi:hypothetical protein